MTLAKPLTAKNLDAYKNAYLIACALCNTALPIYKFSNIQKQMQNTIVLNCNLFRH